MAFLYRRKLSPFWWLSWLNPETAKRECFSTKFTFNNVETAEAKQLKREHTRKELESPRIKRNSAWGGWVEDFLDTRYGTEKIGSRLRYGCAWRNLAMFMEEKEIAGPANFLREHCSQYLKWRTKPNKSQRKYRAGHNSALTEIKFLGVLMEEAILRKFIATNPCRRLGFKRDKGKERPELTEEHQRMIEQGWLHEPEPRRTVFKNSYLIARYHGVRISETYLNPMTDVEIWIEEKKIDGGYVFTPMGTIHFKQKGGQETLKPLHPKLIPLFSQLRRERRAETYPRLKSMSKEWFNFLHRIGVKTQLPRACFHSLRVTAATQMARAGIPQRNAMEYLTHASTTVHNAYVRWRPQDVSNCHQALD